MPSTPCATPPARSSARSTPTPVTTNDDPACAPINPFGVGNVSQAARDYVNAELGQDFTNDQVDLLATLGGTCSRCPAAISASASPTSIATRRREFVPLPANQQGLTGAGAATLPQSGGYNTDEFSAEIRIPIFGGDFTLPIVESFEVTGAFRHVDNSIAGKEDLWASAAAGRSFAASPCARRAAATSGRRR